MVATSCDGRRPDGRPNPARTLGDAVQRLRLVKLSHSDDDLAAAIATGTTLLLSRLDRLLEQREQLYRDIGR